MGWIPSNDVVDKATFGFNFDSNTNQLSGSYHDPRGELLLSNGGTGAIVDVAFKGAGVLHKCTASDPACVSAPPSKGGCSVGEPEYTSQNPALPGSGLVFLLICDLDGNGVANPDLDSIFLTVDTGPYTGYRNQGNPSGATSVKEAPAASIASTARMGNSAAIRVGTSDRKA